MVLEHQDEKANRVADHWGSSGGSSSPREYNVQNGGDQGSLTWLCCRDVGRGTGGAGSSPVVSSD